MTEFIYKNSRPYACMYVRLHWSWTFHARNWQLVCCGNGVGVCSWVVSKSIGSVGNI